MELNVELERRVRHAAFDWLRKQTLTEGEELSWQTITRGFEFEGDWVQTADRWGIYKPPLLEIPLSIRSSSTSDYKNEIGSDNLLRYRYMGGDPHHPQNARLRTAMDLRIPLIYFHGVARNKYKAIWPVHVVDESREDGGFSITVRAGCLS